MNILFIYLDARSARIGEFSSSIFLICSAYLDRLIIFEIGVTLLRGRNCLTKMQERRGEVNKLDAQATALAADNMLYLHHKT